MLAELKVGGQRASDGSSVAGRAGNAGEFVTHEMYGKHFEQTLRGKSAIYHIASQALLLSATTGNCPTVINPFGSGVIFVPTALRICFTSGTATIGSVLLAETLNVSAVATGTGSPILTATLVAAKNGLRGENYASKLLWSPTTNTFTAAPTVIAATGINVAPADPVGGFVAQAKFDGSLAFAPGTALSIVYSVTTSTALFHVTLHGVEVPLPLTA